MVFDWPFQDFSATPPSVLSVKIIMATTLASLLTTDAFSDELRWEQLAPLPDALGVAAPFAGVSGGVLFVAGGAHFPEKMPWKGGTKKWLDHVWRLDAPDGVWREAGRLPGALAYGVSVSTARGVVCAGGSDSARHFAECFRLALRGGALAVESLPPLPVALANHCGALLGDTLFVAGGAEKPGEHAASARVFALDLAVENAVWREIESLPGGPRILAAAGSHDGAFYVFGGAALDAKADGKIARTWLRDAWSYQRGAGWKRLADLPKPLVAAPSPAPFVNGKFLLLAGDDGSLAGFTPVEKHPGFSRAILAYDPARDRWSEAGEVPAARATVPCVAWRGAFIIPSGEVRPGVRSPEIWSLVPR